MRKIITLTVIFLAASSLLACFCTIENNDVRVGSDDTNFDNLFDAWRAKIDKMPQFSKSTSYTKIHEFIQIVSLGHQASSRIVEKIEGMEFPNFFLVDALVAIEEWDPSEFENIDNYQGRAKLALEKYKSPRN